MSATSTDPDDDPTRLATVTVSPDPGFILTFDALEGSEELGQPFLFVLDVSSGQCRQALVSLLGSSVTLSMVRPDKTTRHFNGILTRVVQAGLGGGAYRYRLELRPWIWLLSQTADCRIFQSQSPFDIITSVFRTAGFTDFTDKRQNQSGSTALDYCVQYRESTLDFVTRLMEDCGLYYGFTHADGTHTLVLADDPASFAAVSDTIPFGSDQTEFRAVDDHVWDISSDLQLQPGTVTLRDYNFTTPSADLTARSISAGSHPYGSLERYSYPGPYAVASDGQTLAQLRMQSHAVRRQILGGTTNVRGVVCGARFTLSGLPEAAMNVEYLAIAARYRLDAAESVLESEGEQIDTWRSTFQAVPSSLPFQLEERTPRPRIHGAQTAQVVGQSGDEVTTDQYGRIKVKFFWDRSTAQDETCSCWIRVAQPWAGTGWGALFLPRIGQEVVVEFLDGDPDRPLVTGSVYNATQTVPYTLPDNKTRSTVRSNSSTGGGGNNEMRFEDKKGSEEVFLQAQKDFTLTVLNSETATITQDSTTTVQKGKRSITVSQGDNAVTVSAGNDGLTVTQGNHSITVTKGTSTIQAGTSITLKVGNSLIVIDTSSITLSADTITLSATGALSMSGGSISGTANEALTLAAGSALEASGGTVALEASEAMTLLGATIAIN